MATFTVAPDWGAQLTKKPRVRAARFGDGYEQRVGDGINIDQEKWSLTFSVRTNAERDVILQFLQARGGIEAFDWTSPSGTVGRWVCREWTYVPTNCSVSTVTATFEQDYAP